MDRKFSLLFRLAGAASAAALLAACGGPQDSGQDSNGAEPATPPAESPAATPEAAPEAAEAMDVAPGDAEMSHETASAVINNGAGEQIGTATFTQTPDGVRVEVSIDHGLTPGEHGIHMHEFGVCEGPDFTSAGGHINPMSKAHGLDNPDGPDNADLPNLVVNDDGTAAFDATTPRVSISGGENMPPALLDEDGSALVIHENRDDQMTQPIGGAGARVACGVIEADQD